MSGHENEPIQASVKVSIFTLALFGILLSLLWWGIENQYLFSLIDAAKQVVITWGIPLGVEENFTEKSAFAVLLLGVFISALFSIIVYLILTIKTRARKIAGHLTEELFESREWFRDLYDNGPVPYLMLSPEGNVRQPNKATVRLLGISEKEMYDTYFPDLFSKEHLSEAEQYLEFFKRKVPVDRKEIQMTQNGGGSRWVLLSIFIISPQTRGDHHGLVTLVDITAQKEVEKTKTEFMSLASHQLRTPLASMKWYLDVLLGNDFGALNDKQGDYVRKVYRANERMIELVDLLLSVSRLEMGSIVIKEEDVNLVSLCKDVLEELSPQIKEKELVLVANCGEEVGALSTDPKLLRIVIQNLLSNAIKYTPPKGTITVELVEEVRVLYIKVSDTGYGIPKEAQDEIFTKMFRAENAKKVDTTGVGLGLYMTKAIVQKMGGMISFTSEVDRGTTFTIEFPR